MSPLNRRRWLILLISVFVFIGIALLVRAFAPLPGASGDGAIRLQGDFTLTGTHTGDLVVIGQNITLPAGTRVTGDTALIGAVVVIDAAIDGDLTVIGEQITVSDGTRISGDAALMAGRGLTFAGRAAGDVVLTAAAVELGPAVRAEDGIMVCADALTDRSDGVTVLPCEDRQRLAPFAWLMRLRDGDRGVVEAGVLAASGSGGALAGLLVALSLTALSALIVTAFPAQIDRIVEALRGHPGRYWGAGLASVLLFLGGVIALTVVLGIFAPLGFIFMPVCFAGLLAIIVLGTAGMASVARTVGELLLNRLTREQFPPLVAAAIGGGLIAAGLGALSLLPLGTIAAVLLLIAIAAAGIGAALFTRLGTRAPEG
jgi:hypothetical protein